MNMLSRREEIATRIACALIESNNDPMTRVAALDVSEIATKIADRIIDKCREQEHREAAQGSVPK